MSSTTTAEKYCLGCKSLHASTYVCSARLQEPVEVETINRESIVGEEASAYAVVTNMAQIAEQQVDEARTREFIVGEEASAYAVVTNMAQIVSAIAVTTHAAIVRAEEKAADLQERLEAEFERQEGLMDAGVESEDDHEEHAAPAAGRDVFGVGMIVEVASDPITTAQLVAANHRADVAELQLSETSIRNNIVKDWYDVHAGIQKSIDYERAVRANHISMRSAIGTLLHPLHQSYLRSAGTVGHVAFEEVVADYGVVAFIDTADGGGAEGVPIIVKAPVSPTTTNAADRTVVVSFLLHRGVGKLPKCNTLRYVFDDATATKIPGDFLSGVEATRVMFEGNANNVTSIGKRCLSECSSLTAIDVSAFTNVTSIGDFCLSGCSSLTAIDLSVLQNLTSTGKYFLSDCSSLTAIDLSGLRNLTSSRDCFGKSSKYVTLPSFEFEVLESNSWVKTAATAAKKLWG